MRWGIDALIIINGKERTDSIASIHFRAGKCDVVFNNSTRVYSYNSTNLRILKLIREINPKSVIFKANGCTITEIDRILYFGEYFRIIRANGTALSYHKNDVEIGKNCLHEAHSRELFTYFKETASAISLKTDNGINILEQQYQSWCRIHSIYKHLFERNHHAKLW